MTDPENSRNSSWMRNPPGIVRSIFRMRVDQIISPEKRQKRRQKAEAKRVKSGAPHTVEYFHQLDDPYSHLAAQVLPALAARYDIDLVVHLIPATGGSSQPELEKLAIWARKDAELIAPHYGLAFDANYPVLPDPDLMRKAIDYLPDLSYPERVAELHAISTALWSGQSDRIPDSTWTGEVELADGAASLKKLGHYSGAMFYYGGEWYWGIDRLFYLEQRLRDLGIARGEAAAPDADYIAPRPSIDVSGIDASALRLDFYPSITLS
ncbi:MAG: hypothetical protein AAFV37_07130 [Pseudomonadota bacterium]